jgi:N-acyl homoserine lactone hydrolase
MKTQLLVVAALLLAGCAVSTHAVQPSALGVVRSSAELLAVIDQPGPVVLESVASCEWEVDRGGMINLDHPRAREAGLVDGPEPIEVFFHVVRHPTRGTFIVDTGVETALRDRPDSAAVRGLVAAFMKREKMKFLEPLGEWIAKQSQPISGVLLTHLHLDHVTGLADVPAGTPVYSGPGETSATAFLHLFVQASTDRALEGKPAINEWAYAADQTGRFSGVIDIFGDGSVWAIWVPGHTPGSTAYLVRTVNGPVLLTGDASHTRWGWDHDVEPGSFSADASRSAVSFKQLRALVAEHPGIAVRLGHQR